ncbi:MAG: DUF721 domain-containing protein [Campylobacterales bacterium]|nr:DUF721 domain-containing protein [Campylobacterales bacterium]
MKEVKQVISHLKSYSQFKKLNQFELAEKIKSIMPKYDKFIKTAYIKNNTLNIYINHPALKAEVNYNVSLIKGLLNKIDGIEENILDVKIFLTDIPKPIQNSENSTQIYYKEQSSGNFFEHCENEQIIDKFNKIKEIICSNKR